MGCVPTKQPQRSLPEVDRLKKLPEPEIECLRLIYQDLSERITEQSVNLENFLLFFHKNGLWGERLFKEFDADTSNLIDKEQFMNGIGSIFKSPEKQKIRLLFKFFTKEDSIDTGILFTDFLTMLYNYPKEDLIEILGDNLFLSEISSNLRSIENNRRLESVIQGKVANTETFRYEDKGSDDDPQHQNSMMSKDILSIINNKYKQKKEEVIRVNMGDQAIEVKTSNIHNIVKLFAKKMFKNLGIDTKIGKLKYEQFQTWIQNHSKLYDNYYNGFHNQVWEMDQLTRKPKFATMEGQKQSSAETYIPEKNKHIKVTLFLLHSTLIACEEKKLHKPLTIINLEGLSIKKIFEDSQGSGIEITHRDGVYPAKKFFFINEGVAEEWMEKLKYFKGSTIQQLYDIGKKIGAGKFSVVYECTCLQTKRPYALKVIQTFKLDPQAKALIAHQSSIMSLMDHPLLVDFKECIQTKTHIYIITELVKGVDLFELIKDTKFLSEQESAIVAQQILVGIDYLNSLGMLHRDIKPENIMIPLDEKQTISTIRIIDFGFSNYLSTLINLPIQEVIVGTPNYIAPELLKKEGISMKIDMFSLGVVIYFMLSGTLPFNDFNVAEIYNRTIEGTWSFNQKKWKNISAEAKDLITQLLKNDPKERIGVQQALKHPWFKILKSHELTLEGILKKKNSLNQ